MMKCIEKLNTDLRRQVRYPAELQAHTLTINDLRRMTSLDVTVDVTV